MPRVVYALLTHNLPEQTARLVDVLVREGDGFVVVHHDYSKSDLSLPAHERVHVIRDFVPVTRGGLSQVHACLRALDWPRRHLDYDWIVLLSGQDYPVRPLPAIEQALAAATVAGFVRHRSPEDTRAMCEERYLRRWYSVRRPFRRRRRWTFSRPYNLVFDDRFRCYKASEWWMLSRDVLDHVHEFLARTPRYWKQYERSFIPCESFLQTVVLNGPFRIAAENHRYVRWPAPGARHPAVLTVAQYDDILTSDAWFARKVNPRVCPELIDRLDDHRRATT
jgi:hypothetical protein